MILSVNSERKTALRIIDVIFMLNSKIKSLRDHMLSRRLAVNIAVHDRKLYSHLTEYKVRFSFHCYYLGAICISIAQTQNSPYVKIRGIAIC